MRAQVSTLCKEFCWYTRREISPIYGALRREIEDIVRSQHRLIGSDDVSDSARSRVSLSSRLTDGAAGTSSRRCPAS